MLRDGRPLSPLKLATHAVDALQVLKQRDFPYSNIKFLASSRYISYQKTDP